MIVGEKTAGKTWFMLRLVQSVITGCDWPDGRPYEGETGSVVWCDSEGFIHEVKSRLRDMGVDTSKIITPMMPETNFNGELNSHTGALGYLMTKPEVKLVVMDSWSGCQPTLKSENDAAASKFSTAMARMASLHNKSLSIIHNLNKGFNRENRKLSGGLIELSHIRGSSNILRDIRSVLGYSQPSMDSLERCFHIVSSKLLRWPVPDPIVCTLDPEGLLVFGGAMPATGKPVPTDAVWVWLLECLKKGSMPEYSVRDAAAEKGLDWPAVARISSNRGIRKTPRADGVMMWSLRTEEEMHGFAEGAVYGSRQAMR